MGDSQRPAGPLGPEKLESFRKKLAEFEALGLDPTTLQRLLDERPQDFEKAAEDFLRSEILGEPRPEEAAGTPSAPVAQAPEAPADSADKTPAVPPEAYTAEPAEQGPAPLPTPESSELAPAQASDSPPPVPHGEAAQAVVDDYQEPPPPAQTEAPVDEAPAEPGAPPAAPDLLEMELEAAVAQEEAAASPPPPPLASGDSLEVGYAVPPREEPPAAAAAPAAGPAKKPPPPSARRAAAEEAQAGPTRVRAAPIAPGAKPTAAAAAEGGGSAEAFPEERRTGRGKWAAAVVVLLIVGGLIPYMLFGNSPPVATFTVSGGPHMAGEAVLFSANDTVDKEGQIISYRWDFGDNTNASGRFVEHAYAHSGNYTVRLTVTDAKGATGQAADSVAVEPGRITVPLYTLGESLPYAITGKSSVRAPAGSLGSFTATLPGFGTQTIQILAINATYTGTQARSIAAATAPALDGFIKPHPAYANQRELNLQVHAEVQNTGGISPLVFNGPGRLTQRDYQALATNDTVRTHTVENATLTTIQTQDPTTLSTDATLIEYPDLAAVEDQLHLEEIYAGRTFSTEEPSSGQFNALGESWSWITQGTEIISGRLTIAINVTLTTPEPAQAVFMKVWVASSSAFPLREHYFASGFASGKSYQTEFHSDASGAAYRGTSPVPFQDTSVTYYQPPPGFFVQLGRTPRGGSSPNFAFSASQAYDEVVNASVDFQSFLAANPLAYAVNGTYGLNVGNPQWVLDFAQTPTGERIRVFDEHTPSPFVSTGEGQAGAQRSTTQIGEVVSLDYAAGAIEQEEQGRSLFPAGTFDAAHANFTIRTELAVPSLNFNAASSGTRQGVPYAFGAESRDSQSVRYTAYVDATTGQLIFSLAESGDTLP